jgi:hypothetical protein
MNIHLTLLCLVISINSLPHKTNAFCFGTLCGQVPYVSKICCDRMNRCCAQYEAWYVFDHHLDYSINDQLNDSFLNSVFFITRILPLISISISGDEWSRFKEMYDSSRRDQLSDKR